MPELLPTGGVRRIMRVCTGFRSYLLELHFFVPHRTETAAALAMLAELLTVASKTYPDRTAFTEQLDSLYAADITGQVTLCGDTAMLTIAAEWADDALLPADAGVTEAMCTMLEDCLLHPCAENGAFDAEEFRLALENLLADIACARNDRRSDALRRAAALAYKGEPAEMPVIGTAKTARTATASQTYALWQQILRTAPAEIIAVMPQPCPQIEAMLDRLFAHRAEKDAPPLFAPSPCKPRPRRMTSRIRAVQSRLVLVYKYAEIPHPVLLLLTGILGNAPDSLLFRNVREARGLCYDCSASPVPFKHALVIDCGVQAASLATAETAIRAQIAALQSGDYPDSLIEEAILQIEYSRAVRCDTPDGMAALCLREALSLDCGSAEEQMQALRSITKTQLLEAANALRLDTVLRLRGEGASA